MGATDLSSTDRTKIGARLNQLRARSVPDADRDACRELSMLRQTVRDYDVSVRASRTNVTLSTTGLVATLGAPFFLFAGPVAAAAGLALTIAGPLIALSGWIVSEDREVKLAWVARTLDLIFDLTQLYHCSDFA